jgi:PAS domain-containing protein
MRDANGTILKWFGTCTDIHDLVLTREEAKQTRAQLARVIEHARITLWAVDMDRNLSLFEGQHMYEAGAHQVQREKKDFLGVSIWDIFREQGRDNELQRYRKPLESILAGKTEDETIEVEVSSTGRWFKTRLTPLIRQSRAGGVAGEEFIDGVVGISMDVSDQKRSQRDLERRNQENANLLAQSVAAKVRQKPSGRSTTTQPGQR